ncbi:MAG: hypothetical protein EOO13_03870 [Chitinophagaceae bacterium]|nr:MAG: hypothetical protein EOO13_03870 [Chitinophagaceae bacterium]
MKRILLLQLLFWVYASHAQQSPCSAEPVYRQLDFWVGEWEVFATNGSKAGDSKISLILDSCIILEEWISVQPGKGLRYAGKSFNSYNASSKQWQQKHGWIM